MSLINDKETILAAAAAGQVTYFEYDRSTRLLLQNTGQTEGLQVRVGVVNKARVVVGEQSLDVVEDKAKLVHVFDGLLVCSVLRLQRGGEAADGGCVQHFAHLEGNQIRCYTCHSAGSTYNCVTV